jgi:hydrogenase expression/formation protein HypC
MRCNMCLAVPAILLECDETAANALADLHGNQVRISTALVPGTREGDWVLIHAGFAIQRLEPDEVNETWARLQELGASEDGST